MHNFAVRQCLLEPYHSLVGNVRTSEINRIELFKPFEEPQRIIGDSGIVQRQVRSSGNCPR